MLIADRLRGKQVAVLFVGPVDANVDNEIERAVTDAGGSPPVRIRALKVPLDTTRIDARLDGDLAPVQGEPASRTWAVSSRASSSTAATRPRGTRLTQQFVEEKVGSLRKPVDGVIVARTVKPQGGPTATFLSGFYKGLGDVNVPTIGVEPSGVSQSAVPTWSDAGLSTVDDIDTPAGRLALALLLAGGSIGNYGLKANADDGIVPPLEAAPSG